MKATCFEDLVIWQEARDLSKDIYSISRLPEFSKDYRFIGQITSAAGSIMDNIAEGFERDGNKEFLQFLSIAKGSCGEVRSQLYRAYDIGYIDKEGFETLINKTRILSASIFHFMKNLRNSDMVGKKHKE
jgi:four helix bundle protein